MHNDKEDAEAQRIVAELARRDRELGSDYYALYYPANLYFHQGHEEALLWALRKLDMAPVGDRRVLDVGCGYGDWIGVFERFGARRAALAGIELAEPRVAQAAMRYPGADLRAGDACQMPWADQSFDIVFQRTIISSILDVAIQQQVAREMLRVLRPGGAILWLEFAYDNPRNPNVTGISLKQLRQLFPDCQIRSRSVTLAPPLARRIVPISSTLARLLESLRVFNTHYLAIVQRRS